MKNGNLKRDLSWIDVSILGILCMLGVVTFPSNFSTLVCLVAIGYWVLVSATTR